MNSKAIVVLAILVLLMEAAIANATLVSPPQQIRLEGGSENQKGAWTGGYWTFTVAVDQADSLVGEVYLPADTSTGKDSSGAEVKTKKTIEVQIKPEKAYYRRLLKLAPIEDRIVSPKVYRGGVNKVLGIAWWDLSTSIDPTVVQYYTWAEASWQKYTVFSISWVSEVKH
jgi:hypothetical protein